MGPPILRDFPEAFETGRLLIRSPMPGDGPELHAAVRESMDELLPWMPWTKEHGTVEDSEASAPSAGTLPREDRAPDASLPERDRDARWEQRTSPHRLGGAEVRDRLLVPHPLLRTGLHHRGGPRHSGLRFRSPGGEARGDSVRPDESPERGSPNAPASAWRESCATTPWVRTVPRATRSYSPPYRQASTDRLRDAPSARRVEGLLDR